jgi:hypothetical protein
MDDVRQTLYKDEDVEFLCDYLFDRTLIAMHLNITPGAWSAGKFKKYYDIFINKIVPFLKSRDYHEVYATPFKNDIKAQKLIKMFGLHTYGHSMGFVLMKREI